MADKKISALTAATTPLAGTEELPIVQGGSTVKVSVNNLTAGKPVTASQLTVENNSSSDAVRITQTGAGNALVVEDSANPDATPFVVNNSGNVGIGMSNPISKLHIIGGGIIQQSLAGYGYSAIEGGTPTASSYLAAYNAAGSRVAYVGFFDGTNYTMSTDGATPLAFGTNLAERMRITSAGNVGIGTSSPTALLDVNADTVRVRTAKTPASATATGNAGDICWDSNFVYVCVATNTWRRSALSAW